MKPRSAIIALIFLFSINGLYAEATKSISETEIFLFLFLSLLVFVIYFISLLKFFTLISTDIKTKTFSYIIFALSFIIGAFVFISGFEEGSATKFHVFFGLVPMLYSGLGLVIAYLKKRKADIAAEKRDIEEHGK